VEEFGTCHWLSDGDEEVVGRVVEGVECLEVDPTIGASPTWPGYVVGF